MYLLGMTPITSVVGVVSFLGCLVLIVHSLIPRVSQDRDWTPRTWRVVLQGILETAVLWLWLTFSLQLIFWLFWVGDNIQPFHVNLAKVVAGIVGLCVSGIVAYRVLYTRTSPKFFRFHVWFSLTLFASYGFAFGYESTRSIEGLTAESAARNVFERIKSGIEEPVYFVEVEPDQVDRETGDCKTYSVMTNTEPRARFQICPHRWFGWAFGSSYIFGPSAPRLKEAKEELADPQTSGQAKRKLRRIIEDYPNTKAESEARILLRSAGASASEKK